MKLTEQKFLYGWQTSIFCERYIADYQGFFGEENLNVDLTKLDVSVYCERYVNNVKGDFSSYSVIDPKYDPQSDTPFIMLPYQNFRSDQIEVYSSQPSAHLMNSVYNAQSGRWKYFWHPEMKYFAHPDGLVKVFPTSSARTLIRSDFEFYIKTDLDKKHFRFNRRLKKSSVMHSVAVSQELSRYVSSDKYLKSPARYGFLPESLGVVIAAGDHCGSGTLYREVDPYPLVDQNRIMIPYHSLYALDLKNPTDLPILIQIINLHGSSDPLTFFLDHIVGLIQDAWIRLVADVGILPELHGQNSLIELDQDFYPKRVIHRDFQSIYSDYEIRNLHRLSQFDKHIAGEEEGTTIFSQYSHVYDGMIGRFLFNRLVDTFCNYYQISVQKVREAIKARFHSFSDNHSEKFPPTVYSFDRHASAQEGNEVGLKDTGELPLYR